jgi:hypothetical protein
VLKRLKIAFLDMNDVLDDDVKNLINNCENIL